MRREPLSSALTAKPAKPLVETMFMASPVAAPKAVARTEVAPSDLPFGEER
jgi:hypothetical protein